MKLRPIIFSGKMVRAIMGTDIEIPAEIAVLLDGRRTAIGDRFWIRETFCIENNYDTGPKHKPPFDDGRPSNWIEECGEERYWQQCHYRATDPTPELDIGRPDPGVKWSPSVHMPRWASRITVEVRGVCMDDSRKMWVCRVDSDA